MINERKNRDSFFLEKLFESKSKENKKGKKE